MATSNSPAAFRAELIEQEKAQHQLKDRCFLLDTKDRSQPSASQLFTAQPWSLKPLMVAKTSLNNTKDKLDSLDIKKWGRHTSTTNRAGLLVEHLRRTFGPEMCTIAWSKMYEMLEMFDLLPAHMTHQSSTGTRPPVFTLHLCEAPGAFICATNHYMKIKRTDCDWQWRGVSLNPYFEGNDRGAMIEDDALISRTMSNWCFADTEHGGDGSGDICKPNNVKAIWTACTQAVADAWGGNCDVGHIKAALVTADGSVDCQENPNEQERTTATLHYCELVAALGALAAGGSLVLKAFTFFEHSSIAVLGLMGSLFDQVWVTKPCASKPGNSETYLIGQGFRGISEQLLGAMLDGIERVPVGQDLFADIVLLGLNDMPQSFLSSAVACAEYFAREQQCIIEENLATWGNLSGFRRRELEDAKRWLASEWPNSVRVEHLPPSLFLAPSATLDGRNNTTNISNSRFDKKPAGTLQERRAWYEGRRATLNTYGNPQATGKRDRSPDAPCTSSEWSKRPRRAEDGMRNEFYSSSSGTHAGCITQQSNAVMGMMAKMGYKQGMGLGAGGRGMLEPVAAAGTMAKYGLGFDPIQAAATQGAGFGQLTTHSHTAGNAISSSLLTDPFPDTNCLENEEPCSVVDIKEWCIEVTTVVPRMLGSKFLPSHDMLVQLTSARNKAHLTVDTSVPASDSQAGLQGQEQASGSSHSVSCQSQPCCHNGISCMAPYSSLPAATSGGKGGQQAQRKAGFWKLAGTDAALDLLPMLQATSANNLEVMDLSLTERSPAGHFMELFAPDSLKWELLLLPSESATAFQATAANSNIHILQAPEELSTSSTGDWPFSSAACRHLGTTHAVQLVVGNLCGIDDLRPLQPHSRTAEAQGVELLKLGVMEQEYQPLLRMSLLWEAATGLATLVPGGVLVLRVADSLTTFTASLVYMLHKCFQRVCLVKPFTMCTASAEKMLVCMGHLADGSGPVLDHLLGVFEKQRQCVQTGVGTTGYFAPIHALTSAPFLPYLAARNASFISRELAALAACARSSSATVQEQTETNVNNIAKSLTHLEQLKQRRLTARLQRWSGPVIGTDGAQILRQLHISPAGPALDGVVELKITSFPLRASLVDEARLKNVKITATAAEGHEPLLLHFAAQLQGYRGEGQEKGKPAVAFFTTGAREGVLVPRITADGRPLPELLVVWVKKNGV